MTMMTRETQGAIADRHDKAVVQDRGGRRAALSCRLFFFGDDDFEGEGTLRDISTSGCRASSLIAVQPGMLLKLSVFLPDYLWPLRVDEAMVRWVNGQEFGVEFTRIRLAQRERLRALVMKEKP
jgi:hypothetical protein